MAVATGTGVEGSGLEKLCVQWALRKCNIRSMQKIIGRHMCGGGNMPCMNSFIDSPLDNLLHLYPIRQFETKRRSLSPFGLC